MRELACGEGRRLGLGTLARRIEDRPLHAAELLGIEGPALEVARLGPKGSCPAEARAAAASASTSCLSLSQASTSHPAAASGRPKVPQPA